MTTNGFHRNDTGLANQPGCATPQLAVNRSLPQQDWSRLQHAFATTTHPYWPEPDTMEEQLPPVAAFDTRLLPEALRPMVEDVADRMQVPIDFPAAVAIVALAGTVNRRALVQPKRNDHSWRVVPNLWGALVGPPGQKKTPTIRDITAPLRKIEGDWRKEHEAATLEYERQAEQAELLTSAWREEFKKASKRSADLPERPQFALEPPHAHRLLTTDGTFEALHRLLGSNPAGLFVLRDELTGWLASLERAGHEETRAFYLECWNGDCSFTVDRIGRGTVHVEHCCLSLFGGIQPARLRSYLADALADGPSNDGLIQRFQVMVWPDPHATWQYHDRVPSAVAFAQADAVFHRLAHMDADNPAVFRFARDAQELFVEWLTGLEQQLIAETLDPVMVAHLAKYRSLMPAIALLLALADGCENEIPLLQAQRAASWCVYLQSHARRVYAAKLAPQRSAALLLAKRLRQGWRQGEAVFSLRDVYHNAWSGLGTPDEARAALLILEEAGWVRKQPREKDGQGGRPTEQWSLNPRIYAMRSHEGDQ
jgi:putative DNA primase/helicase